MGGALSLPDLTLVNRAGNNIVHNFVNFGGQCWLVSLDIEPVLETLFHCDAGHHLILTLCSGASL